MSTQVEIVADSVSEAGARLTTYKLRFERFILPEFNTHRAFSRNARSSRAVPVQRILDEVRTDPVIPTEWRANKRGMQAGEELPDNIKDEASKVWLHARDVARRCASSLSVKGVHKQWANRLVEPFMWVDVVVTSCPPGLMNFFAQRCHADAQPEMCRLAVMMARAYRDSVPKVVDHGDWHIPFITPEERNGLDSRTLARISVARCARVSYLAHDGKQTEIGADIQLAADLEHDGHWSPFEHQARASYAQSERSGNFVGWQQYRQMVQTKPPAFDFATLEQFAS